MASELENTSQKPSDPARMNLKFYRRLSFTYSGLQIMPSELERFIPKERVMKVPG